MGLFPSKNRNNSDVNLNDSDENNQNNNKNKNNNNNKRKRFSRKSVSATTTTTTPTSPTSPTSPNNNNNRKSTAVNGLCDPTTNNNNNNEDINSNNNNNNYGETAVFGVPLHVAAQRSDPLGKACVPAIIRHSIDFLNEYGLNEVGLYRVPGSKQTIYQYRDRFNRGQPIDFIAERKSGAVLHDPADVAGLILLFLRDLPESLFGPPPSSSQQSNDNNSSTTTNSSNTKYVDQLSILQRVPKHLRKQMVHERMSTIPRCNRETIRLLVDHWIRVTKNERVNKMNTKNIVLCIWATSSYTPVFFTLMEEFDYVFNGLDDCEDDGEEKLKQNNNFVAENKKSMESEDEEEAKEENGDGEENGDDKNDRKSKRYSKNHNASNNNNNNGGGDGGGSLEWLRRELEASNSGTSGNNQQSTPTTTQGVDGRKGRPLTVSFDALKGMNFDADDICDNGGDSRPKSARKSRGNKAFSKNFDVKDMKLLEQLPPDDHL